METSAPIFLGACVGAVIIHFASNGVATLLTRSKTVIDTIPAENQIAVEKVDRFGPRANMIFLPDTLAKWQWPGRINPHYAEVDRESDAWFLNVGAHNPRVQLALKHCKRNLLACMGYPTASKEHARIGCDMTGLLLVIEEHSDVAEPSEVRKQKDVIMDALRNPNKERPKGEWIGGEVARQFWELAIQNASKQSQKRFIKTFDEHLDGVVQQAIDRSGNHIRDIKSYFGVRRRTIAVMPSFALLELALDIPDEVISHPAIQEMTLASIDMMVLDNDIFSYNVEQSCGDNHNIITLAMHEFGTDVNGAILWAQDFHTGLETKFHAAMTVLPEWEEPLNSQVKEYCNGLANWVRANYDWSFESERYFGSRGPEIKEKRWMKLIPRK